jgi:hypothetical protein
MSAETDGFRGLCAQSLQYLGVERGETAGAAFALSSGFPSDATRITSAAEDLTMFCSRCRTLARSTIADSVPRRSLLADCMGA